MKLAYDFKDTGPILYNATALGLVGSIWGIFIGGLCFFLTGTKNHFRQRLNNIQCYQNC